MTVTPNPPPTGHPVRRRNPQVTRDRLVRAAAELFTAQGYHATTTPDIARRAGVAEGTIYRHFSSKQHLFNEIYRAALRVLESAIRDAPPGPCRERLAHVARAWHAIALRDPALVRLGFFPPCGAELDGKSRDARRRLRDGIGAVIASGKAAAEVRTGAADLWMDVWLELVTLVLERTVDGEWPKGHPAPEHVIAVAWDAIRTPS
jgi:AcrR family transcriptional regulator